MKKRPIGTLPNFNEIYSTERKPMDYGGGSAFTQDGGGLEAAVDQYEDGNAFVQDGGGLEVAVDRYKDGNAFVQDGGGLEVAVDRYKDGNAFVQDGVRDWSDPMNKDVDDEVQINTDTQGQYDTNPKQKKNKIFALLVGVAAAYFLLK